MPMPILPEVLELVKKYGPSIINGTITDNELEVLWGSFKGKKPEIEGSLGDPAADAATLRALAAQELTKSSSPAGITSDNYRANDARKFFVLYLGEFLSDYQLYQLNKRLIKLEGKNNSLAGAMRQNSIAEFFFIYALARFSKQELDRVSGDTAQFTMPVALRALVKDDLEPVMVDANNLGKAGAQCQSGETVLNGMFNFLIGTHHRLIQEFITSDIWTKVHPIVTSYNVISVYDAAANPVTLVSNPEQDVANARAFFSKLEQDKPGDVSRPELRQSEVPAAAVVFNFSREQHKAFWQTRIDRIKASINTLINRQKKKTSVDHSLEALVATLGEIDFEKMQDFKSIISILDSIHMRLSGVSQRPNATKLKAEMEKIQALMLLVTRDAALIKEKKSIEENEPKVDIGLLFRFLCRENSFTADEARMHVRTAFATTHLFPGQIVTFFVDFQHRQIVDMYFIDAAEKAEFMASVFVTDLHLQYLLENLDVFAWVEKSAPEHVRKLLDGKCNFGADGLEHSLAASAIDLSFAPSRASLAVNLGVLWRASQNKTLKLETRDVVARYLKKLDQVPRVGFMSKLWTSGFFWPSNRSFAIEDLEQHQEFFTWLNDWAPCALSAWLTSRALTNSKLAAALLSRPEFRALLTVRDFSELAEALYSSDKTAFNRMLASENMMFSEGEFLFLVRLKFESEAEKKLIGADVAARTLMAARAGNIFVSREIKSTLRIMARGYDNPDAVETAARHLRKMQKKGEMTLDAFFDFCTEINVDEPSKKFLRRLLFKACKDVDISFFNDSEKGPLRRAVIEEYFATPEQREQFIGAKLSGTFLDAEGVDFTWAAKMAPGSVRALCSTVADVAVFNDVYVRRAAAACFARSTVSAKTAFIRALLKNGNDLSILVANPQVLGWCAAISLPAVQECIATRGSEFITRDAVEAYLRIEPYVMSSEVSTGLTLLLIHLLRSQDPEQKIDLDFIKNYSKKIQAVINASERSEIADVLLFLMENPNAFNMQNEAEIYARAAEAFAAQGAATPLSTEATSFEVILGFVTNNLEKLIFIEDNLACGVVSNFLCAQANRLESNNRVQFVLLLLGMEKIKGLFASTQLVALVRTLKDPRQFVRDLLQQTEKELTVEQWLALSEIVEAKKNRRAQAQYLLKEKKNWSEEMRAHLDSIIDPRKLKAISDVSSAPIGVEAATPEQLQNPNYSYNPTDIRDLVTMQLDDSEIVFGGTLVLFLNDNDDHNPSFNVFLNQALASDLPHVVAIDPRSGKDSLKEPAQWLGLTVKRKVDMNGDLVKTKDDRQAYVVTIMDPRGSGFKDDVDVAQYAPRENMIRLPASHKSFWMDTVPCLQAVIEKVNEAAKDAAITKVVVTAKTQTTSPCDSGVYTVSNLVTRRVVEGSAQELRDVHAQVLGEQAPVPPRLYSANDIDYLLKRQLRGVQDVCVMPSLVLCDSSSHKRVFADVIKAVQQHPERTYLIPVNVSKTKEQAHWVGFSFYREVDEGDNDHFVVRIDHPKGIGDVDFVQLAVTKGIDIIKDALSECGEEICTIDVINNHTFVAQVGENDSGPCVVEFLRRVGRYAEVDPDQQPPLDISALRAQHNQLFSSQQDEERPLDFLGIFRLRKTESQKPLDVVLAENNMVVPASGYDSDASDYEPSAWREETPFPSTLHASRGI